MWAHLGPTEAAESRPLFGSAVAVYARQLHHARHGCPATCELRDAAMDVPRASKRRNDLVNMLPNDFVAFASRLLEPIAVQNFDLAA
jgi:hypothetical protein